MSGTPSDSGIGGSTSGTITPSGSDYTTNPVASSVIPVGPDFSLAYTEDTGVNVGATNAASSSKGGGFGISLGGIGLGASSSKSSSSQQQAEVDVANSFQASTQITNATPDSISSVENFLERIGGTAEQRMTEQRNLLATSSEVVTNLVGKKSTPLPTQETVTPSIPANYAGAVAQPTP
jgi:hypothetical protein